MSKPFDYKEAAKRLRAFGLGGNFNLARKLSPQQKSAITRKYDKFKSIVDYADNYQILTVKTKTANDISIAAKKIKLKNGKSKLIIPIEKGQKVKIQRGRAVFTGGGFNEEVFKGGYDFFENAKKVFKKKLKKGEYITVRIGDHRQFHRTFKDMKTLLLYMGEWFPTNVKDNQDPFNKKEELISHISILRTNAPPEKEKRKRTAKKLKSNIKGKK